MEIWPIAVEKRRLLGKSSSTGTLFRVALEHARGQRPRRFRPKSIAAAAAAFDFTVARLCVSLPDATGSSSAGGGAKKNKEPTG